MDKDKKIELSEEQARSLVKDLIIACENKENLIKYLTQSTLEVLSDEPDDLRLTYMIGNSLELIKDELKEMNEHERIAWNALINVLMKEHSERAKKVLERNIQRFTALKINDNDD